MALTFNSVDPRTGEPGPSYEEATADDVRAAVAAAAEVHRSGALRDRARRAALLRGAAGRLRAAGDEIVEDSVDNSGTLSMDSWDYEGFTSTATRSLEMSLTGTGRIMGTVM